MKVGAFSYSYPKYKPANIGDCIQTIAVEQHLPRVDIYLDRDRLNEYDGEECIVVMNGWFSHKPEAWPPSDKIIPIFHGFHMTDGAAKHYSKFVGYFRKHQPIGCRDRRTLEIVRSWGLEAYLSFCCTLTFPTRANPPAEDYFVFADVRRSLMRRAFRSRGVESRHSIVPVDPMMQLDYARKMLEFYRDEASHVVTSRIHAAMPCISMGIPTLYIGNINYRTNILKDIGVDIKYLWNKKSPISYYKMFNMSKDNFYMPNIDSLKKEISDTLKSRLHAFGL